MSSPLGVLSAPADDLLLQTKALTHNAMELYGLVKGALNRACDAAEQNDVDRDVTPLLCWSSALGSLDIAVGLIEQVANYLKILANLKAGGAGDGDASGTCSVCACTELHPCLGGCSWVDPSRSLCSRCAINAAAAEAVRQ